VLTVARTVVRTVVLRGDTDPPRLMRCQQI